MRDGDPRDEMTPPSQFAGGTWMLAMFEQLDRRLNAHGMEMRTGFKDVRGDISDMSEQLGAHAADDAIVARDVALIKQARDIEASTVTKRGAIAGIVGSTTMIITWEVIKHLVGWK